MRTNLLVTIAGIMAALGGVPVLIATSGITPPLWWSHVAFFFVLIGVVGVALMGWAAKGQDGHSTSAQVEGSTTANPGIQAAAVAANKVAAIEAPTGGSK
jgi:fatty acid desaturase